MEQPRSRSGDIRGLVAVGLVVAVALASGLLARADEAPAAGRVVLQSGFEEGTNAWRGVRARLERVRGGHQSRFALRVAPRRATRSISIFRLAGARPRTVRNGVYSAAAWVRSRRAGRVCIRVRELAGERRVGGARTCRRVGRRWERLSFSGYRARGGGHRLDYSVIRKGARARSFVVDRITLHCRKASGGLCGGSGGGGGSGSGSGIPVPYEPAPPAPDSWWYSSGSYWKKPVRSAPLDPRSAEYISYWQSRSSNPKINLVAAGCADGQVCSYSWSLWHSEATDPLITVLGCNIGCPLTFHAPALSRPAPGDGEITVIDHAAHRMYEFGGCDSWTPGGTARCEYSSSSDLDSNGLDRRLAASDSNQNWGHRGLSCMTFGFSFDEVKAREIAHMVKMTVPSDVTDDTFVFPYVGTEDGTGILPEGLRVRLKDSALPRIQALDNPYAKAMAMALYRYGSTISDQGGSGINIKMQNPGYWGSLGIGPQSLSMFTVDDFEVVEAGWR
jgi:hypothetical protein